MLHELQKEEQHARASVFSSFEIKTIRLRSMWRYFFSEKTLTGKLK